MGKHKEHIVIDDGTSIYPIHISEIDYLEIEEGYDALNSFDDLDKAFEYAEQQMIGRYDEV